MKPPTRDRVVAALSDSESFGTTLLLATIAMLGLDPFIDEWSPEALIAEIRDGGVQLGQLQAGKLLAAGSIIASNRFFADVHDFVDIANALNGEGYDPRVVDLVDCLEAAWALTEATIIMTAIYEPSDDDQAEITPSKEIIDYIATAMDNEGLIIPPAALRIAANDPDRLANVLGPFSDDPDMASAIYDTQSEKTAAIDAEVKRRLTSLLDQTSRLFDRPVNDLIRMFGLE